MTLLQVELQEEHLQGVSLSQGIAVGKLFFMPINEEFVAEHEIAREVIDEEIERYRRAVVKAKQEVCLLQEKLAKEGIAEGVAILEAHLQMMQDSSLTLQVEKEIRATGKNAEHVFQSIIKKYKERFGSLADPFFRERFKELQDVSYRILCCLRDEVSLSLGRIPADSILFAEELSATHVAEAALAGVKAFVTRYGSSTSHAAIVSNAKGIPLVTSIELAYHEQLCNSIVLVDGCTGEVFINPSRDTLATRADIFHISDQSECFDASMGFETYDGHAVRLSANVEALHELEYLHAHGSSGVGLYRSEYAFLSHGEFPTEDEQYEVYREIVENMRGLPIVIRTFDLGGDKYMACQQVPHENNPFLGCRAIRFLLREKEIFRDQLKAVLRVCRFGNVSVLFPLVTSLSELLEAKQLLHEAQYEIEQREGIEIPPIRIGCMIEVPSAALIADILAKECDFISIGTNDLVQYTLAVDRGNHILTNLYTPAHPSVIRLIKHIVIEANHCGIPVSVCGEVAADPRFTPLLIGLGIDEFSVGPRHIAAIKQAIRNTSIIEACQLADTALHLSTPQEIQQLLVHS